MENYINNLKPETFTHEPKFIATIYVLDNKMIKFDATVENDGTSTQYVFEINQEMNKIKFNCINNEFLISSTNLLNSII